MVAESTVKPNFVWSVRVYWEDTDAGGVVYHASYVRFLERARSEWLRALGIVQSELRSQSGIVFVVHRIEIDYRKPSRLDDLLSINVRAHDVRGASFMVDQELRCGSEDQVRVAARVRIACLDADRFRPRPLPPFILSEIAT